MSTTEFTESTASPQAATPTRGRTVFGASLAAAAAVQAAGNLVFHASVSRRLDATGYGTVATLLAAVLLLTVPLGSLQVAMATARRDALHTDARPLMRRVTLWSAVVGLLLVVAAPSVASFLHLPSARMAAMLAPCLVFGAIAATLRGLALGEGRVGRVAASIVTSTVARVGLGILLTARMGIAGAMWATAAAELVAVVTVGLPGSTGDDEMRLGWRHLGRNASVVLGLWCFTGVDSILARHFLGAAGASGYLAAGTLTRVGLALPLALVMANITQFGSDDLDAARRSALRVAVLVGAWGTVTAVGFVVAGNLAQHILFGARFAPAGLLVLLGVVAGLSGLVTTCTYFLLAQDRPAAQLPWLAAIVEIVVICIWHATPALVAMGSGISLLVALLVMLAVMLRTPAPLAKPQHLPLDDTLWSPVDGSVELSVVMPFYNPGESVGRTVATVCELMRAANVPFEVIPVSDGSRDGSEAHVEAVGAPEVRLIVLPENHGKGGALMRGFSAARGRFVAFIDADGDIDPVHLIGYLERIREGGDMVYACKRDGDSASASSPLRKLISLGFSIYTSVLFRLGVSDTQTGCKIMRREMMADVLPHMHERRFAFDLELFVVAKRRGHSDLRPAPVELGERLAGSTVTTKAVVRTLKDSLVIWKRLHVLRHYPAVDRITPTPTLVPAFAEELAQLRAVA